jgi:hypothetical protein
VDESLIKDLLAAHHVATGQRLRGIEDRLVRIEDKIDTHEHGKNPTWANLSPIFVALVAAILVVG